MKQIFALYSAILVTFIGATSQAQHFPTVLNDEMSQTALGQNTRKVTILIHGWQPCGGSGNAYASGSLYNLSQQLKSSFLGTEWQLVLYRWEQDADTANPLLCNGVLNLGSLDAASATVAANNALLHGAKIAQLLNQQAPNVRQVHIIAHSAGTWAAYQAAHDLLQSNPFVAIQVTLLDGYVPGTGSLTTTTIESLATAQGNDRIFRLENYYGTFLNGDPADIFWSDCNHTFSWRSNIDTNLVVSFNSLMNGVNFWCYHGHDGPIDFYADSVLAALPIGQGQVSGCLSGAPYSFTENGFYKSLFYERYFLPVIASNPQTLSANNGAAALLQVIASSSQALSYQWFLNGQRINGATSASYSFTVNSTTSGDYVVEVSNQYGFVFSEKATVSIVAAAAPTTTSIDPTSLPTSSSAQLITIYGTNFKPAGDPNASTLIFHDPANNPYVRTPANVTANSLQYYVNVQSATGTWSVIVTNAGLAASNPQTFTVYAPSANTGSLVVNLAPAGANSAGAQWQVNGTYYNSGAVAPALTPGQYTISFKPVSGYTTPASQTVTITANAQATVNASYTAIAPSTYALTLNYNNTQGGASPSPLASGNIYTAGAVVQLYASASSGYHFTGWSGDASGTANPITITMNGNKSITANFASGDPNMGTVIVTIQPPAAAAAGVTWGFNASDYRPSGSSYTTWPEIYILTLHAVDGWLGPASLVATVTAGQTSNYVAAFTADTTPGLLTVTLSPPDAVTAGAKWHVNGGAAQGNGAAVSLAPGTNYEVTFDSVAGWVAPLSQTVSVQRAQTRIVSGNYAPPAGQPLIGSISPPLGSMSGGTLLSIGGVNFTTPATVLIGGQPATNVTVSSSTLLTCITPASSVYGSAPVVLQTFGGRTTNVNGFAYGMTLGQKIGLSSSIGGSCFGAAVQGNYAYVGEGRNLLVLDVSTPSSPSRVGKVTLPGVVMDVALLGQYAYVAALEGGLQVVNISNPTAPSICGFYSTTNRPWAEGIAILGGLAYVADDNAGLEIFDLGNPVVPTLLSSTNCGDGVAVKVKATSGGVFAYVSTGGGLSVLDVSQPSSPTLLGQTAVGDWGIYGSIALYGNSVIGATLSGAIHIIDVSQPTAPVDALLQTGDNGTGGYSQLAMAGGYLYAESEVSGIGFTVFTVSGTTATRVGRNGNIVSSGGFYNKMVTSGSRAYVAGGGTGLQIVDVSNPGGPVLTAGFTDSGLYGNYGAAGVSGNYLCTGSGDFKVFDVSNPSQPSLVGQLSGIGAFKIVAGNGAAYATANGNVVDVISIGSGSPQIVGTIASSVVLPTRLALGGNLLCVSGTTGPGQARFVTVDVSSPLAPVVRGTKDFEAGMAISVAASGTKAAVGISPGTGQPRLAFLDISNIAAPAERGSLTNVSAQGIKISADGNYAFVSDSVSLGLLVINISNLSNPTVVTNVAVDSATPTGLDMRGSELYFSTSRGLYVFDIGVPAAPVLSRSYGVSYIFGGICAPTDSAAQARSVYLADSDGGIVVLAEQDIQAPNIYITYPTFSAVYTNATASVGLGGGSDDDTGVTRVAWSNSRGGGGEVSGPFDSWLVNGIGLLPGTNVLTVTAFDAAGNAGSDILTVIYQTTNQNQTITFPAIADHMFGDAPIPLVAAASSGLPVTFTVISGPATLTGSNVLTLTGAGAVTVEANQSGNGSFNSATPVDMNFNVARANQSIAFTPIPNHSAGDPPFVLTGTTSSGLPVYFNVISGPAITSSNMVILLGGGTITVVAWQPGDSNYNAAATVQQGFTVSKIPQTITFGTLSQQKAGDAPFPLTATTDSGLPVSFSASGPATLSGNILTLTGWGTVTVTASQPGNNIYAAAANVTQSFFVVPPDNTIGSALRLPDGSFQLAFYGAVGSNYTLQASTDLKNWTSVLNFTCTDLPTLVVDPGAKYLGWRFYRVSQGSLPILVLLNLNASASWRTNGPVLTLQGPLGFSHSVQVSTDLLNWQPLTNFVLTDSPAYFNDPAATNYSRRFYRATMP